MSEWKQGVYLLNDDLWFPPAECAIDEGLLALGGDLNPERLILAYSSGIFPWYNTENDIMWFAPNPRAVLFLDEFKISRSLKKSIRNSGIEVKFNTDFAAVIEKCSTVHGSTWILPEMKQAYNKLHAMGLAWSVESYFENKLVGGLYGVVLGKCFFGESMFSEKSDASKIALAALVKKLRLEDFAFIDCQLESSHLLSLGVRNITLTEYLNLLQKNL